MLRRQERGFYSLMVERKTSIHAPFCLGDTKAGCILFRKLPTDRPEGQVFAGPELTEGHLKVRFARVRVFSFPDLVNARVSTWNSVPKLIERCVLSIWNVSFVCAPVVISSLVGKQRLYLKPKKRPISHEPRGSNLSFLLGEPDFKSGKSSTGQGRRNSGFESEERNSNTLEILVRITRVTEQMRLFCNRN